MNLTPEERDAVIQELAKRCKDVVYSRAVEVATQWFRSAVTLEPNEQCRLTYTLSFVYDDFLQIVNRVRREDGPQYPLIYSGHHDWPVLTIENYCKWYCLWLVQPNGRVQRVEFPDEGPEVPGSPFVDHVPNPAHVINFCERLKYGLDATSLEVIIGRWYALRNG